MKHVLFIYNPVAGTGRVKKNLFEIVDFYNSNECIITLCPILKLDEFYEGLEIEQKKYDRIICSGGDGTLNIVISFLKQKNLQTEIAYIPSGSTNDYAYSLGISNDLNQALKTTLYGNNKAIDLGKFNDKYFLYVAAFGMFTKVAYSTSQKVKNILGHTAYVLEGIRQLSELKAYQIIMKTEEEVIEGAFILGLVTNSLSIGGFKNIMPNDVALDDGKFEVVLIKKPENLTELHGIITSLTGESLDDNRCIVHCKTRHVDFVSQEELDWTLDGEYGGRHGHVEIANLQKDVLMVV